MTRNDTLRRVLGTGATWGSLWLAFWVLVGTAIGIANPESIDPGEPLGMVVIFGAMGLMSGLILGGLRSTFSGSAPSMLRTAGLGILATALVQVAFLGHGDQGLLANLQMAGAFSLIGGLVTIVWQVLGRVGSQRRPSLGHS